MFEDCWGSVLLAAALPDAKQIASGH